VLQHQDGRLSARTPTVQSSYTDDDHKFIENGFKSIMQRAFPLPAADPTTDDRFQALLDALERVHQRDR
jgi:hypothetical protein